MVGKAKPALRSAPAKPAAGPELRVRIVVVGPVTGCSYALQRGRSDTEQAQLGGSKPLAFALPVTLRTLPDGASDVRGAHVQGPRGARFVYINSGTLAGQASCWTRRAKVPLRGVEQLADSADGSTFVIEARIAGQARDLGPACGTVPLIGGGWRRVDA